jgi:hypothetical protein
MGRLWLRDITLTFSGDGGTLTVQQDARGQMLHTRFRVTKTLSGSPNTATIEIANMKAESRLKIQKEFDRVRIEAGHIEAGNKGIIFDGFLREVKHKREGADIITTVECGDGDKGHRQGVIAKTFPAGTKPKDMIEEILKQMPEVDRGTFQGLDDLPAYPRPVVMCGACRSELDKIGRTHRLYWSIQDGALEIVEGNRAINETVVISQNTGMIGVPSVTDNGIQVACILNPQIKIGRVIEVRSETLDMNDEQGRFRVSGITFAGDTHADEYMADITGERLDGEDVIEE